MAFCVANNCFESGGSCLLLEVGPPGRAGTVKCRGEGCLSFGVVPFETADPVESSSCSESYWNFTEGCLTLSEVVASGDGLTT